MNYKTRTLASLAVGIFVSGLANSIGSAQTSDALLNKLVEKGILSTTEADALKKETAQEVKSDFSKSFQAKTGLADWVTGLKFNGDFRGRYEYFTTPNEAALDRTRWRYRLRIGTTLNLKDNFEVGLRLASADPAPGGSFGGNPVSNSSTFQDNGSKKFVYIDAAYARWTPIHDERWTLSTTIGKMDSPFQLSNMVWDYDYTPEGAAAQLGYNLNDRHSLKLIGAAYVLDEVASSNHDPFVYGGQVVWNAAWTPKIESSLGLSAFSIVNRENLGRTSSGADVVPNVNSGNTRGPGGNLLYNYNPVIGSASVTYKLDSFPLYQGVFPVKLGGEFMNNPAAPAQNSGYWAGVTLGKSGRKGMWDLSYRYEYLEGDAWYEEFVDEDATAFYQSASAKSGGDTGYRGGTNFKGHLVKMNYSFTDSLTFSVIYYRNTLIERPAGSRSSEASHFMADINLKF